MKKFKTLIRKADNVFSRYIRTKYADNFGLVSCVTCPIKKPIKEMQAGHYVSRDIKNGLTLRYSEINVHPQCYSCNIKKSGAKEVYAIYLIKKYGIRVLEELDEMRNEKINDNKLYLETVISTYQTKQGEKNEH